MTSTSKAATTAGARRRAAARKAADPHMPTIAEASNRFNQTHSYHEPGSRSALNFHFTGRLNLIARRYRTRLNEALKTIGQTQARWDALFWISVSGDDATQSELAERMGVEGPTLVRMLNKLEQEGLVERMDAPGDRRAKTIRLKPEAEAAMARIADLTRPLRDEIMGEFTDQELMTCLSVFDRVMTRLERE